ncbi:MAG: hypothetical protein KA479_04890 [Saprospiraceae bacterium]|nr:hypothetical protein [Saprospiraceae bacterium]
MKRLIFIIIFFIGKTLQAQNIFPENFQDCNTDHFALESDTTVAKISDEDFINIIIGGFGKKTKQKIKGILSMQIIVDLDGKSCLLSIENKTNISSSKLKIKNTIDTYLIWNKPTKKVAAIVVLNFSNNKISLKRFGLNGNIGWHEITDKPNESTKVPIENKNHNAENNPTILKDKKTDSVWKLFNTSNSAIPYNMSRSVDIDSNGVVWYCTDEGIVKIENNIWTVLTAQNSPLPSNKYGKTITTGLAIDKQNRVWVESFGKVMMYDGINWIKYDSVNSPLNLVQDISVDRNGVIWFGTFNGLVKFDNGEWVEYNTNNSQIPSNNVRKVFLDNNNIIWVATEGGISKFDNKNWIVFNTTNSELPSNSVACVTGDKSGNIWIGTNEVKGKGGLAKIDNSGFWTVYTKENSKLPTNTIWEIEVENNIIWLGHNNGGLVRLDGENWEIYNTLNSIIPHDYVCSIAIDKNGNKWIATFGGLVFTTR